MASNKNALIRYKTLDRCLRNTYRKYTLEDLMEECSAALFEYEGKESFVSRRTVQLDLQNMRSSRFGYEAPIEVYGRKYYRYSDPDYSIHKIEVNSSDLLVMNNAIQILKQFKDFSMFKEMNGVIQKLEDSVHAAGQKAVIHLDKNEQLTGLEFIDPLYKAIVNRQALRILYQSFKAREASYLTVHPQLLKEYNNRWFLICWHKNRMLNLALDRIKEVETDLKTEYIFKDFDADSYFANVVGVTVSESQRPQEVVFRVDRGLAPYVKTKPIHHSQQLIGEEEEGLVFSIKVQLNPELERVILGMGSSLTVISPARLRGRIIANLKAAVSNYGE